MTAVPDDRLNLFFLLVTSPTSTHALAKAALTHGLKPMLAEEEDPSSSA